MKRLWSTSRRSGRKNESHQSVIKKLTKQQGRREEEGEGGEKRGGDGGQREGFRGSRERGGREERKMGK